MDTNKINEGVTKVIANINELKGFDIAEKIAVLQSTASLLQNTLAAESLKEIYKNVFKNMLGGNNG
jgi:hypothetical protein